MKKEIISGLAGSTSLFLFYFLVMGLSSGSWSVTVSQFRQLWYWMILLSFGFGIQIGLFVYLRNCVKNPQMMSHSKAVTTTSTGTSAVSMIACCAHHLSDVLPIIGLSGAAVFLTRYQIQLIILGIGMNAFGILYMIRMIRKVKNSML
ncbi:hypothetical protein A2859_03350 [Candidatus Roizmanbacteria bacterium RIFCSPHIGHO2_01_FULL_37_16b]|nr:MAG: hypothetical protein A2859_03350 [Candidatus Roizmanbacteria bacterium RIFCSPHIGHO2_01_FULL_37_16b]